MIRRFCRSVLPATLLLPLLLTGHSGGWATITVEDLPDYVVANQESNLVFTVRQHGVEPINTLTPTILARAGKQTARANAVRTKNAGEYAVALNLPEPGDWTVTINTGFGPSNVTLLPLRATGAGAMDRPTFSPAERGKRLFVAKGCVTCHVRQDVEGSGKLQLPDGKGFIVHKVGPDLTELRLAPEYLARFLADPTIKPPTTQARMPNLRLKPNEIAALVAFLNGEVKQGDVKKSGSKKSD